MDSFIRSYDRVLDPKTLQDVLKIAATTDDRQRSRGGARFNVRNNGTDYANNLVLDRGKVGIGTASPRAKLDVDGAIKIKTSSENVHPLDISSNNVDVDLSKGQSFTLSVDSAVSQFTLLNPPDDATSFTIKIHQGNVGYSVGINTFKD